MLADPAQDRRFMAAAIRLSLRHLGRTATNPSVGTLIVDDRGVIVGRGVTAVGGRPHAEPQALAQTGEGAKGATAYVTLEPCAHHGRTPPCANALVAAGIRRVVGAAVDPDPRVAGRGYAILRDAGIEVTEGVLATEAAEAMAGYLMRSLRKRPHVTVKLALSADGMIGREGEGQLPITGAVARAQVQMMRAASDAIMVGINTALADDPLLTVRLPGLETRSPTRIVLDRNSRLPRASKLVQTVRDVPVRVAARAGNERRAALEAEGVGVLAVEDFEGRIAMPELLEDLAAQGIANLFVEGGAATVEALLDDGLVDSLVLFRGQLRVGAGGVASPVAWDVPPAGFRLVRESRFGDDLCREWRRG
ncbi:MAG: bifunctional diaminohydroxyphosphoribosylaminopyrimidine deaminase/5-amino-6-(5-phosphoribosylamino)uracil reductase RibD [Methylobacterium mesophilicum]|nr:bifunctional diaminohydroxyphosphoribosylaminopyrimidine deaminase/5-amino-6-(5-phosphoribosylamino)uracil reductase RibD [Methylobacterium mesophilicum]